jgi:SEC-C motif-containing protein
MEPVDDADVAGAPQLGEVPFHTTGTVAFRAHFTQDGRPGVQYEQSCFARHEGAWVHVDGTFFD